MVRRVLELILAVLAKLGIMRQARVLPEPPNSSSQTPSDPPLPPPPPKNPEDILSPEDVQKLTELYPPFAAVVKQLIVEANKQYGMCVGIFEGLRSFERQKQLYAQGRDSEGKIVDYHKVVTDAPPGMSSHQYGLAVDLVFKVPAHNSKGWEWSWSSKLPWKALAEMGKSLGLDAAMFWKKFPEDPHFENVYGLAYAELKAIYLNGNCSLDAVWEKLDQMNG